MTDEVFHFSARRVGMAIVGVLGLLLMPFGATGVRIARWAREHRDG